MVNFFFLESITVAQLIIAASVSGILLRQLGMTLGCRVSVRVAGTDCKNHVMAGTCPLAATVCQISPGVT